MTTVVRCPSTGRACSEPTCQERHWCRKMFERGLAQRAAFEAQIPTKVLRQDPSRSPVHHEGSAGRAAMPLPWWAIDRPRDNRRQSQNCRSAATSLEGAFRAAHGTLPLISC